MNAIAMRPTVMNVMPSPRSGFGTSLYAIFSRMAARPTMASVQPIEGWGESLHDHLHELHHACDDGDEEDEAEECEVNSFHDCVFGKYLRLEQIVNGNGDEQDECDCYAESQGSLHGLGYCEVGAHAQEECEDHIVHEYRTDEQTKYMFHK